MTWQVSSFALLAVVLAAGFLWYERRRPPARVVGVVAVLAALAVVGRLAFAAIPNVKPTTDIVLFAGYALGSAPGFAVGAIGALASNVFLGQGPWTVWQMAAWGAVGVGGAVLAWATRGRELGRLELALYCGIAGLAFGAVMDVYQWTLAARQDLSTYLAIAATSLPYNIAHAVGNVAFCLVIGPVFIRSLRRYRSRFEASWPVSAPAVRRGAAGGAVAAAVAALALATGIATPAASPDQARAQTADTALSGSAQRAAAYLRRAQNRDGGFGSAPRQSSSQLVTGWAALGLAAARQSPRAVRKRPGRTVIAYLRRNSRSFDDVGELQRTMLVLRAAGVSPRRFAGVNLLARLRRGQRRDGSWQGNVAFTAFGLLALRATGEKPRAPRVSRAAAFLERARTGSGGWGVVPGGPPDVDDTGAVLQALAAAGRRRGAASRAGVVYLRAVQDPGGGWGQMEGRDPNSQSTAWAVQGLVAARAGLDSLAADPLEYLRSLQRRDGSIAYSETSDQTPVWATAQALAALQERPLPIPPVRRGRTAALTPAEVAAGAAPPEEEVGGPPAGLVLAGIAVALGASGLAVWALSNRGRTARRPG
ncbi:MAG: hypothetical protein GXY03_00145 [Solirubrobacterales bacterium]|nr:hypothetical protein [Solirubrobacterales bacterium]